jgi:dipeptidyl aminopeptidase/acylaminoacyl peptidase
MQIRRCLLCLSIASIILCALPVLLVAQSFSLEQVMSSPFPSDLVASKRGDKLAWAFDAEGKRNIWIAEAPAYAARQLTHYEKDDGGELTDLVFAPNGGLIAYARGNEQGKNSAGEYANPTSDPDGTRKEIVVADTRTGRVTVIGEGEAPMFNAAGDQIIYSREGKLWTAPFVGGKERKLFEIRGNIGAREWSPDGSELAFVSNRGDHSFIGIYNSKSGSIRFLSPSVDRDQQPRWSTNGRRIAFIRLFNISDNFSLDRERLQPWAIFVGDARTGAAKQIWHSGDQDNDSYPQAPDFWQWVAGDRLLFPSEKDGWTHLYSISADGGDVTALTPGNFEVENIALPPDKSFVTFSTNKSDIDRRHLWWVNVAGGSPRQITAGEGIEMYPVLFDNGRRVAFLHSTAQEPFMPFSANIDGSGRKALAPQALPRDFPVAHLVTPEQVIFKAADGLDIHGQLFKPKNASGKMPALIFTHGGPPRQMLLGWHYMYYYHNSYAMNQYLASRGYMVLSVNYRSGIGYGRAFRLAQHRGARGASEYQDVVAGAKYLRNRDDVDTKRVGLWGGSYGGYLTALGLARNSDIFSAGVDFHGVHDWSLRVGGLPLQFNNQEQTRVARESSPIASVDKWKSPVLLIHGDDDRNVEFAQTVNLVRLLRKNNVYFEELIFPDEIHDLLLHKDWVRSYRAGVDFFDKHLK